MPVIKLTPLAINFLAKESLCGKVFFGDASRPVFVDRADLSHTLTAADLTNPAFESPDFSKSFPFVGFIPGFPELGHFGGTGEPQIFVFIQQALLPDNVFTWSFENQVGVFGTPGNSGLGTAGQYTYRFEFLMPFTGPGTAHHWTLADFRITQDKINFQPGTILQILPTVPSDGSTTFTPPAPGDVPPGFMARAVGQFVLPPQVSVDLFADGFFKDVCGQVFCFTVTPIAAAGP